MNLPESDRDYLRALVKESRQRSVHVRWVDRDGTNRITVLSAADAARLNQLGQQLGLSKEALLRQAAELPALKRPSTPPQE